MQSLETSAETPAALPSAPREMAPGLRSPRIWKFWGTTFWGVFVFAAMFAGQLAVVAYFVWRQNGPIDLAAAVHVIGGGLTISLSVIMGLPAVLAALWLAIHLSRTPFADYLALRWTSWRHLLIGIGALIALMVVWDLLSRAIGHEQPGFMTDVMKSGRAEGVVWLMILAFCVAAPVSEEFFARGFLYRGWSESFLGPIGAIFLSSLVWTALHLQYDWFGFGEVFSIGLLFGFLRYHYHSIWLTVVLHGINNLAATLQSIWLAGSF